MRYAVWNDRVWDTEAKAWLAPADPGWAMYQRWLGEGNVPDVHVRPADPPPTAEEIAARAEITTRDTIIGELRVDAAVRALANRSPAQVDAWIDANVSSVADARAVLRIIARILALLTRERL